MFEADELCGRVAVITGGRIVAEDTPATLKAGIADRPGYTLTMPKPERAPRGLTASILARPATKWRRRFSSASVPVLERRDLLDEDDFGEIADDVLSPRQSVEQR